jgi:hypothetical protein
MKIKEPNYKKAFNLLMEYFDEFSYETKEELNESLKECGL